MASRTYLLAKEDMFVAAKLFRPRRDLAFQTAKAILGASVGYSWCPAGCQGQFALLLSRFCSFLLINFLDLSSRIEAGEEICSNYLDDPETTYCARSLRQVSTNLRFGTLSAKLFSYSIFRGLVSGIPAKMGISLYLPLMWSNW